MPILFTVCSNSTYVRSRGSRKRFYLYKICTISFYYLIELIKVYIYMNGCKCKLN